MQVNHVTQASTCLFYLFIFCCLFCFLANFAERFVYVDCVPTFQDCLSNVWKTTGGAFEIVSFDVVQYNFLCLILEFAVNNCLA